MNGLTLHAIVRENARSAPDRPAVISGDDCYTYRELDDRSTRLAELFLELGVGAGDRIAWLGQNSHRWLESVLAAGRLGAMLCSLNWRFSRVELDEVLTDFAPKVVLWQEAELGRLAGELRQKHCDAVWLGHDDVSVDGYEARLSGIAIARHEPLEDAARPVLILSVPDPKGGTAGSMVSHQNLLVPAFLMGHLQAIDRNTVNLASAPLFHIAGLFSMFPTLQMRGVNVMVERAEPLALCEAIDRHRCTHGFLLGPTAEAIVQVNADGRYDLSTFRSSLAVEGWRAMIAEDTSPWGRSPGGYGQTETNMAILAALGDGASMTSGWPAPYAEVQIVDANDQPLGAGELGEIVVRGPSVHCGYWNREERNKLRFRGGWWHTGDLGRREGDGRIVFVGAAGRMIKSGAENIYASEVERCLAIHPAIREVAVIGVPDEVWIQSVCAVVVLAPDAELTEADVQQHCREHLASYKKPRSVVFRQEALPRNGPAIDYASLDVAYGGGGYPGEGTRST